MDAENAIKMFLNQGAPVGSTKTALDKAAPTILGMINPQYGEKRNLFSHTDTGSTGPYRTILGDSK